MSIQFWRTLIAEASQTAKHKSAVQPILWSFVLLCFPCFFLATNTTYRILQISLVIIGAVPVLLFTVAYLYFMIKDPERLHSEEYQLRRRVLDILVTKGGKIKTKEVNIGLITDLSGESEDRRAIESGEEGRIKKCCVLTCLSSATVSALAKPFKRSLIHGLKFAIGCYACPTPCFSCPRNRLQSSRDSS